MKLIILILGFLIAGCTKEGDKSDAIFTRAGMGAVFTVEHEGCEYVVYDGSREGGIIHKPTCKFCEARWKADAEKESRLW